MGFLIEFSLVCLAIGAAITVALLVLKGRL